MPRYTGDMEERHVQSAVTILKEAHYINLSTVCDDGAPWGTPVSANRVGLNFEWGSSPDNVHSQNIARDKRVFVTIYDTHAPEGKGEAVYLSGRASMMRHEGSVAMYQFVPERVWINDEVKNDDGSFKSDIRVALDLEELDKILRA